MRITQVVVLVILVASIGNAQDRTGQQLACKFLASDAFYVAMTEWEWSSDPPNSGFPHQPETRKRASDRLLFISALCPSQIKETDEHANWRETYSKWVEGLGREDNSTIDTPRLIASAASRLTSSSVPPWMESLRAKLSKVNATAGGKVLVCPAAMYDHGLMRDWVDDPGGHSAEVFPRLLLFSMLACRDHMFHFLAANRDLQLTNSRSLWAALASEIGADAFHASDDRELKILKRQKAELVEYLAAQQVSSDIAEAHQFFLKTLRDVCLSEVDKNIPCAAAKRSKSAQSGASDN